MIKYILLFTFISLPTALAHDLWINGKQNAAGEWCCGEGDCAVMDPKSVTLTSKGYIIFGWGTIFPPGKEPIREFYHEAVPEAEALPSPDGAYWRCHRWDKERSRRCFFAPPPNG